MRSPVTLKLWQAIAAVLIVALGSAWGINATNSASVKADRALIKDVASAERDLEHKTKQFCREVVDLRVLIRQRAIYQKEAFKLIAQVTERFDVPETKKFERLYRNVKIVPVPK